MIMKRLAALTALLVFVGCQNPNSQPAATGSLHQRSAADLERGKELFERYCVSCHTTTRPKDRSKMVAPAISGVMFHTKERFKNKDQAVAFIVDYVRHPSRDKALCPSVRRFGVMPALNLPEDELRAIAEYLWETYPPAGFQHPKMGRKMMAP
jgi:mono/diheme cytochrome c family protein